MTGWWTPSSPGVTRQAIARRVEEMIDSGADHVLLQPLADDAIGALSLLESLAPAVLHKRS